jgi:hypothetical protein
VPQQTSPSWPQPLMSTAAPATLMSTSPPTDASLLVPPFLLLQPTRIANAKK